jgi:hypothetical protein
MFLCAKVLTDKIKCDSLMIMVIQTGKKYMIIIADDEDLSDYESFIAPAGKADLIRRMDEQHFNHIKLPQRQPILSRLQQMIYRLFPGDLRHD